MGLNVGYLTADKESDELYTPFYAVDHIIGRLNGRPRIWCPFDKDWSAFPVRLREFGYDVITSHIDGGKDFFNYAPGDYDMIISNPPFSKKDAVLKRLDENMASPVKGTPFASAYFCKGVLGRDLIVEELNVYERGLVRRYGE